MNHSAIDGLVKALAPIVGDFVAKAIAPVRAENMRLAAELEQVKSAIAAIPETRAPDEPLILRLVNEAVASIPPAQPGKDADPALVAELVDKAVAALPVPKDGESVTLADVAPMIANEVGKAVAAIDVPKGPDVDAIASMVSDKVKEAIAALPVPKDGEPGLPGKDAEPEKVAEILPTVMQGIITDEVRKTLEVWPFPAPEKGEPGEPGKSVSLEDVAPLIAAEVAKAIEAVELPKPDAAEIERLVADIVERAVAALPAPPAGKDADPALLAQMVADEVSKSVAALPVAKDGIGLAGALIDREGQLVVTMTDGSSKGLGVVVGKDVDMDAVGEMIGAAVASIPRPKDGIDGLGFDDLDVVDVDGDCVLRFSRGETIKDFVLPITTYRGVWTDKSYRKGSGVTWAGSYWIAERDTKGKPDTPDSGWRLAVKKGRDGKPGEPGKQGTPGIKGDKGERGFPGMNAG